MSANRMVTIFCDGRAPDGFTCLQWEFTGHDAREARANAKAGGWAVALPGGRDLCPACRHGAAAPGGEG